MARNKIPFRLRIRCQERDDADASTSQKKKRKQKNNKDNSCTRRSKRQKHQKDLNNTATSTTCSRNDQNHLMASSNNTGKKKSRTQNWRDKLKEKDAKKYDKIKASSRMYSQCYRINMALAERTLRKRNITNKEREEAEEWLGKKVHYNKESNKRQKKYQAKKKIEKELNKNKPVVPLTRQKADKKKEYERNKKRRQRAAYTEQRREAEKARRRELYAEKKETVENRIFEEKRRLLQEEEQRLKDMEERLKAHETELQQCQNEVTSKSKQLEQREQALQEAEESPSKELDKRNDTARRQSLSRAKSFMPKKLSHFTGTVVDLINKASPRTSSALKRAGVEVRKSKRKLTLDEAVTAEVDKSLKENAPKKRKVLGTTLSSLQKYKLGRSACRRFKINRKLIHGTNRLRGRKQVYQETVENVKKFYESNSTQIPDKKLVSKKTGKPVHLLDRPVGVLYKEYCTANPDKPVGKSVFYTLRPKHVRTKQQAQYYGCLCEYCENVELKLKVLQHATEAQHVRSIYAISNHTLCEKTPATTFHRKECLQRRCKECGVERLDDLKKVNSGEEDRRVEWKRWELIETECHTKKATKVVKKRSLIVKEGTVSELVEELKEEVMPFSEHLFNKDWQHAQQRSLQANLPANSVLSIMDFSENYKCSFQREVQSAYYSQDSATLHPIVSYYHCPTCNKLVQESSIMISNDLTHDHHLVNTFQKTVVDHLKNTRKLNVNTLYRWSDGCSSQYKSKGPFSDISYALEDFGLVVDHNFFGTRHGKGPSDGEGAVIKSKASQAVLAGTAVIASAKSLYEFSRDHLTKVAEEGKCCREFLRSSFFVPFEEVNRDRGSRQVKTVKGTRLLHSVKTVRGGKIATRNLTCMCDGCIGDGVCSNSMYVDDWKLVDLRDERNSDVTSEDNVEADQSGDHGGNGDIGPDDDADHDEDDDYTGTDDAHGDDEQNEEDGHGNKPITGLTNGKFVAVRFTSQQRNLIYLAMITDIPEGGVILKFLRYNSKEDYYYFTAEKEHTHPVEDIIAVLKEPAMSTVKRAYVYKFCPQELELIAEREQADLK